MAKQRGVVQLSGRVDNLCYYQQKRVRGGLVRRINLAMSERVKEGAEYQKLRIANSYFGACSMCAASIIRMTGTRASFLHEGSRQAILTKGILNLQKRYYPDAIPNAVELPAGAGRYLPFAYDEIVKNKMSNYFPSVPYFLDEVISGSTCVLFISSDELENYCLYNNCIGIRFGWSTECYIYGTARDSQTNAFYYPDSGYNRVRYSMDWYKDDGELELHLKSSNNDDACRFSILYALPIVREVGGRVVTKYTGSCARLIGMIP